MRTKQERKNISAEKRAEANKGYGSFVFENNTRGELTLPRATKEGRRKIGYKERFNGDDYYMQLVKSNDLRLIDVLVTKEQELASEKLITEQPPTVTVDGKVEFVKKNQKTKLNESQPKNEEDILLNESPMDGIEIL